MIELEQMMDSIPLTECKKEIEQQLDSIATHGNIMKRAVLLCILGEAVLKEIAKIDSDIFIDELKTVIDNIADNNSEKGKQLMAHIKENEEIIINIDTLSDDLRNISKKVTELMTDYDYRLAEIIRKRDNLAISKL